MDTMRSVAAGDGNADRHALRGVHVADAAEPRDAPIAGVLFDVDDVLYDATSWRRWLLKLVNQLGIRAEFGPFYRVWDRDYLVDVRCGRREYTEALQSFLLASGLTWAQMDEVEAAGRIRRETLEGAYRAGPGVVKTVAALDALGLPLVAWFDACQPAVELVKRLERLALAHHFQAVLSSFDLECAQPSPRCYQAALSALGRAAGETLYVGHDTEHLAAARAAGLQTAAFNSQPGASANFRLTCFEELLSLVSPTSVSPCVASSQVQLAAKADPGRDSARFLAGNCR